MKETLSSNMIKNKTQIPTKYVKEFIKDFQNFLKLKRRWTRVELMDWIKENAGEDLTKRGKD